MSTEFKLPTEVIDLPSKGLLYSEDSPLASGQVEIKYMTAKEEDILTNQTYMAKGIVIDKLLESLVVGTINFDEMLIGDKNAILVGARILGYGKDYTFNYFGDKVTVDLTKLENKPINEELFKNRTNEFDFQLPASGVNITFKLLTHADENAIEKEIEGLKKVHKEQTFDLITRLKHTITSVEGERNQGKVREFVEKMLLARDARALREYIRNIQPDVDTKVQIEGGPEGGLDIPFGVTFFWPDAGV